MKPNNRISYLCLIYRSGIRTGKHRAAGTPLAAVELVGPTNERTSFMSVPHAAGWRVLASCARPDGPSASCTASVKYCRRFVAIGYESSPYKTVALCYWTFSPHIRIPISRNVSCNCFRGRVGLRRWIKAPISQGAWVRIPPGTCSLVVFALKCCLLTCIEVLHASSPSTS